MNIFAASLVQETNTFSSLPSTERDFTVLRPDDICHSKNCREGQYALSDIEPIGVWQQTALEDGHTFIFGLAAFAQPSGIAVRSFYENLRDELLQTLRDAGPKDVVLLFLHGALVAEGYDDCEGDILARVRDIVGNDSVIAVELDLHCHLTEQMLTAADCIITFKEYPHLDIADRGAELIKLAIATAQGRIRPTMAQFDCKMMGLYPTSSPALRQFLDETVALLEQRAEVLSVSFAHGFPFGDVADAGAKMLAVTDNNPALAAALARELGLKIFALRHDIGFNSLSLDEAMNRALTLSETDTNAPPQPIVVADQSDNPGCGAPGDATYVLQWLLDHQVSNVGLAILYDPKVVKQAKTAGVGNGLSVHLGGKLTVTSGDPVALTVEVLAIKNNHQHSWPQQSGDPIKTPLGDTAALRVIISGGETGSSIGCPKENEAIDIIVSSERCQCFSPCIFTDFGIDPARKRILIPKSTQHFYGAFAPIAQEVIYMAAPGAVAPNVEANPYQKMETKDKYPWVENPHELLN